MRDLGARPSGIGFTEADVAEELAPSLTVLGIEVSIGRRPDFLDELLASLRGGLGGPRRSRAAPRSLEDWKELDRIVADLLLARVEKQDGPSVCALGRYFGSLEDADEVLSEMAYLGPMAAFVEWLAADYRPTKRSRTLVEKELQKKRLTPAERVLLEARAAAVLTLCRVDACEPGATLDVEDVLTGEQRVVHDRALSGCDLEGRFVLLRLLRVEKWTFPCLAGPPISALRVARALRFLEDLGVEFSKDGLRRDADRVGLLWAWVLAAERTPPRLENADGETFEPRSVTFEVGDVDALVAALDGREDVDREDGASWTWFRVNEPALVPGQVTPLARMTLFDSELVVEVNSAGRRERAREWIKRLPGARFVRERVHELGPAGPPVDDLLPGPPLREDARARVTEHFHAVSRGWVDQRVPALGNMTPRDACKTRKGREGVARLVRAMPPMLVQGAMVQPPREETLRELGIE